MRHNYRKIPMFHAVKMPPFTEKLLMHTHTQTLLLAKVNNGPEEFTILKPIHNGAKSLVNSNFGDQFLWRIVSVHVLNLLRKLAVVQIRYFFFCNPFVECISSIHFSLFGQSDQKQKKISCPACLIFFNSSKPVLTENFFFFIDQ